MVNKIVTISKFMPPKAVIDEFAQTYNYTFIYDTPLNYVEYIKKSPINEYPIDTFNKIQNETIKRFVFILYYLYINGGFHIDLKVHPTLKILDLDFSNKFYVVKSMVDSSGLFLGVIGCNKHNKDVLSLIHTLSNLSTYDNINKIVYDSVISYKSTCVLREQKINVDNASTLNDKNEILFNHYYENKYFYKYPLKNNKLDINDCGKIKIGVTLKLFDHVRHFFSNGINQNSLYLCELLLAAGYDVYFIVNDTDFFTISDTNLKEQLYDERFKIVKFSEILTKEFNIIITLSFSDNNAYVHKYLKYMKTILVGYFCGNSYIIDTEKILYNQHKTRKDTYDYIIDGVPKYDEIWSIPQMSDINLHYWRILHRCNVINVPFIWSKNAIKLHSILNKCSEEDLIYKPKNIEKKVAIFEPNLSIMKWALPSILISEDCYRINKNIKHLYITNISDHKIVDFNMEQFNIFMKNLDIVKDHKCSIEGRYNTLEFMRKTADIAVSHQWGNPLNYLYFDLAWLGYPILHNARLCSDVGYYYDDFDYLSASNLLNIIINNHDKHIDSYISKNRDIISKYLPTNNDLLLQYKCLINNLLTKYI